MVNHKRRKVMEESRRKATCPVCQTIRTVNRRGEIMFHTQYGLICKGIYAKVADRIHYPKVVDYEPPRPAERIRELQELLALGRLAPEAAERAQKYTIPNLRKLI
jgi:hypothetical protein